MCLPDGMLKNYFTIALRQLRRNGTNSILNLFGLAIGIACAGLIFLWVEDEWTFSDPIFPSVSHHFQKAALQTELIRVLVLRMFVLQPDGSSDKHLPIVVEFEFSVTRPR